MVLNQDPAPKYPNILSVSRLKISERIFSQETKENHPTWQIATSESYQAPKTAFCHMQKYLAAIFFSPFLWCVSMTERCKHSTFFVCVICEPESMFTERYSSNSTFIGKMQS